jgi:hypothetical protein
MVSYNCPFDMSPSSLAVTIATPRRWLGVAARP